MAELPRHEDRFEDFYIRYDVEGDADLPWGIRATVWQACEWRDGKPVFFNAGPDAPGMDPAAIDPLCELLVKIIDGCSHLRMPYFHFDEMEQFESFARLVTYIREDICDRHDPSVNGQSDTAS